MSTKPDSIISQNSVFGWIAVATGILLLIPLIAMQFTNDVSWDIFDFAVMGILLFGTSSLFVLVSRKVPRKYWSVIGALFAAAFLYLWAELAVGIFTTWGS
jgi:hypothetical protein